MERSAPFRGFGGAFLPARRVYRASIRAGREHAGEFCRRKGRGRRGKRVEFHEQLGNRQLHLVLRRAQPFEALIPIVDREYHTAFRGQDRVEQRIAASPGSPLNPARAREPPWVWAALWHSSHTPAASANPCGSRSPIASGRVTVSLSVDFVSSRAAASASYHFSTHGRSTTSNAQVERCWRCRCR